MRRSANALDQRVVRATFNYTAYATLLGIIGGYIEADRWFLELGVPFLFWFTSTIAFLGVVSIILRVVQIVLNDIR